MSAKKKQGKKWKRVIKRIILTIIVLAVLGVAGLIGLDALRQEYTVTYDTYTATIGSISNALSFSGSLQLVDSETHTASASATVKNVYVKAGDTVKKDQKLMRLSNGETIKAGMDGKVNVIDWAVDDTVTAGDTLVQVADFDNLRVSFRVDEYDIAHVHVGDEVTVTTTASEQKYTSTIRTINYVSASTGNVAYYTTTVDVQVGEGVYPGMQVTVSIPQESAENVVVLKADAISFDVRNSAFVYTQNEDGTMKENPIEVGVSNGNYVEIKSGVKNGDVVYAVAKQTVNSMFAMMMSGAFGSTRINGMGNYTRNNNNNTNRNNNNSGAGNYGGPNNR